MVSPYDNKGQDHCILDT